MVSLADLLPLALLQRPLAGPAFNSWLPKSPTNVTAGSPSAPQAPQADWAKLMSAFTGMSESEQQNELRKAQADKLKRESEILAGVNLNDIFSQPAPGGAGGAFGAFAPAPPISSPDLGGGLKAGGALQ